MKRIRVLIVDDIGETRDSIRRLLEFEPDIEVIGDAGSGSEALRLAERLLPDIVLMDINMPDMDGIRTTELLALRAPEAQVVIMSVQGEPAYLRRAMMAGAREYIVKPFTSDELASTIVKVFEIERTKKEALGEPEQNMVQTSSKKRDGKILSFFSTKGGVGKTTLATNLAVQLASSGKRRVLLVDLNLQFGDVSVFLNLIPKRTIADLTQGGSLNYADIEPYILTHSSGLQVLAAPTRPEYAELISVEHIQQILSEIKPNFDFIICDNSSRFDDFSLLTFDMADQIYLVVAMDVPTIKNTKLSLETMETIHFKEKVKVILNRSSKEMGLDVKDIEKALNFNISYEIPSDGKALVSALNKGTPFVESFPQSKVAESIRRMQMDLAPGTQVLETKTKEEIPSTEKSSKSWKGIRKVFSF